MESPEPETMDLFSGRARWFTACVTILGSIVFAAGLSSWSSNDLVFFCIYLYLTLLATGLRIRRAFHAQAVPVQFLFVLAALRELSFSETVLLAAASSLLEALIQTRTRLLKPDGWFRGAVMTLAAAAAWLVYHNLTAAWPAVAGPLVLMLAASAYFAASTWLVSQAMAFSANASVRAIWPELHLRSYPYYLVGATMASLFRFTDRSFNWMAYLFALPVLYLLLRSYRLHVDRLLAEKARAEKMADVHRQTVEALASAVEAKDQLTHGHLLRVQIYSLELGKALKLSKEQMESLRAASILHDIGKVGVPDRILCKPGKLTREEFERVKLHTEIGAEMLERVDFPYPVAAVVRAHHERWDGQGYPDGLEGEQIPLAARILAVADFLDATTSDRQYRLAASMDEALAMVSAQSGSAFDPRVVETLKEHLPEMLRLAWRQTSKMQSQIRAKMLKSQAGPARGYQVDAPATERLPAGGTAWTLLKQEIHASVELAEGLRDTLSFNESLSVLAERLRGAIPFDALALYLNENDKLVPCYVTGENARLLSHLEIPRGQGVSGGEADHTTPILNANPALEPGYPQQAEGSRQLRTALTVPQKSPNGLLGVHSLYREEPEAFTSDQLNLLREISPCLSRAGENARKFHPSEAAASSDYLTRLPNARALIRHLSGEIVRAERENRPLTVMMCAVGVRAARAGVPSGSQSEVLRSLAEILKAACRPYDYLARWDVNRFAAILPGVDIEMAGVRCAELIQTANATARLCYADGRAIMSAGAASYPLHGASAEELLTAAEARMTSIAPQQGSQLGLKAKVPGIASA